MRDALTIATLVLLAIVTVVAVVQHQRVSSLSADLAEAQHDLGGCVTSLRSAAGALERQNEVIERYALELQRRTELLDGARDEADRIRRQRDRAAADILAGDVPAAADSAMAWLRDLSPTLSSRWR